MALFRRGKTVPIEEAEKLDYDLRVEKANRAFAVERLAELEIMLEDEAWIRLGFEGEREFSQAGLTRIVNLSRLMWLKNPMVRRAVSITSYYVFGQGVEFKARDENVQLAIDRLVTEEGNRRALFGHQARKKKNQTLMIDGNVFFTLFTNRFTGEVQVRSIPVDEIIEIVLDPNDRLRPMFYHRKAAPSSFDVTSGVSTPADLDCYYLDWRFNPAAPLPHSINGKPIDEARIYHVKVGELEHMRYGVPETYPALDWALAYKTFLENWSSIVSALQEFAWNFKTTGSRVAGAKARFASTVNMSGGLERNPPAPSGSTFVTSGDTQMTPIRTSGATVSAEDGKQVALMVSAATGVPHTMLMGDADQGNRATAKTLDRPTELMFADRQELWAEVYTDIFRFAVEAAAVSPPIPKLSGTVKTRNGQRYVQLPDSLNDAVDVMFPPILEGDTSLNVKAIVDAATLGNTSNTGPVAFDIETTTRMLLTALGETDVDQLVNEIMSKTGTVTAADASLASEAKALREAIERHAKSA